MDNNNIIYIRETYISRSEYPITFSKDLSTNVIVNDSENCILKEMCTCFSKDGDVYEQYIRRFLKEFNYV